MKRMIKVFAILFALSVAFGCETKRTDDRDTNKVAEEQNEEKFEAKDAEKDAAFVADQVAENYAEVQLAKLATQKSTNPEVKKIAEMLVNEHSKSLEELKNLASAKAITVPSEPENDDKRTVENLREEQTVADFNKEWVKEMVETHEENIEEFEDQVKDTEDADLKAWINQKLPGMRSHLNELKACEEKLEKS